MKRKVIVLLTILSVAFIGAKGLNKIMSEDEINEIVMN
jgi:hypothetical protein